MIIQQESNGNIVIYNSVKEILHIIPTAYIHRHPRHPKKAIFINDSTDITNEQSGITILANKVTQVNTVPFNGNANKLLYLLTTEISVGSGAKTQEKPKTKEQDPLYVTYLQMNTYEKMLAFVKKHQSNIGGKQFHTDGRIHSEEFLCQFETFIIKVHLQYFYRQGNSKQIDNILMFGNIENVFKARKVYKYNASNALTGFIYEEVISSN